MTEAENNVAPLRDDQDRLTKKHRARTDAARDFTTYLGSPWLPELPETDAQQVYERLIEAEQRLAAPTLRNEAYSEGVARYDDEIHLSEGERGVLISTEHATDQQRLYRDGRRKKEGENGLAALGQLLHEDTGATHLSMLGRQTGDPNNDREHPYKREIGRILNKDARTRLFASIHGMTAGHISDVDDERAFDVSIGIGTTPSGLTQAHAEAVVGLARDLDLRAGINPSFVSLKRRDPFTPNFNNDGSLKTYRFSAAGNTTRQHAETAGPTGLAALQIEYSDFLRLYPVERTRDLKSRYMGAYMGYLLLKQTVELTI